MPIDIRRKLAVQMFTVREFTKTRSDLAETFRRIRGIGYPAVQISAVGAMGGDSPEVSAADARKMLDDNGLRCIATHRGWDPLKNQTDAEIEFHHTLGCDYVAVGSMPGAYAGPDGYRRWLSEARPMAAKLAAAGIRFGYHNHAFEFERIGGESLYDILIRGGAPDIMLELDVYWAQHAGWDPVRVIEAAHGRLPVVHVKDKEIAAGEPVMAPIGEGNLDWPEIIPALDTAGCEWYAVEQDECRRDPFDCLRSSYEYLAGRGW